MKSVLIGGLLFSFIFRASAGKFLETFNDNKLKGWQELVLLNGAPGSWKIVDGELRAISLGGLTRMLTMGDKLWGDYDIEYDVKPLKKHGPGNLAIAARITGTWVIWCVIGDLPIAAPESRALCSGGNFHNDKVLLLGLKPSPFLRLNKWATLKLSVRENNLTFWINEKRVLGPLGIPGRNAVQGIDPEFPDFLTGGVGFGLTNYSVLFDNIAITGEGVPDKGGLSVTTTDKLATMWSRLKQF